jgi:hypothetical protein
LEFHVIGRLVVQAHAVDEAAVVQLRENPGAGSLRTRTRTEFGLGARLTLRVNPHTDAQKFSEIGWDARKREIIVGR